MGTGIGEGEAWPVVRVEPLGAAIPVPPGSSLMAAAERLGYRWPTVCRGSAACTRCWIAVAPEHEAALAPMGPAERAALERVRWLDGPVAGERLACQVRVLADCTVVKERVGPPAAKEVS